MVYLPPEAKLAPKKYRESYLFQAKYLAYLPVSKRSYMQIITWQLHVLM